MEELLPHPAASSATTTLAAGTAKRERRRAARRGAIFMGDLNLMVESTVAAPHHGAAPRTITQY